MHSIHQCALGFARLVLGVALGLALGSASLAQQAPSQAAPKPAWPDNGIAQREFPNGSIMFVENEHGKLRAWIVEFLITKHKYVQPKYVQALDFFSGERIRVKPEWFPDGEQDFAFTDAKGVFHAATDKGFRFKGPTLGSDLADLNFYEKFLRLTGTNHACNANLHAITTTYQIAGNKKERSKFPIYHTVRAQPSCASGRYQSLVNTALDLDDGTFLVTEGCYVFRLRKSDLSPVGSAPSLRVVDESVVQAVIDQVKGKPIDDVSGYLAKALNLPTDPKLSCKED